MNDQREDRLMAEAGKLSQSISPERDLWPGIAEAIRAGTAHELVLFAVDLRRHAVGAAEVAAIE